MSQIKVAAYFLHMALAAFALALATGFLFSTLLERQTGALPYAGALLLITLAWTLWRVQLQKRFRFKMSRDAYRVFAPTALLFFAVLALSANQIASEYLGFRPESKLLVFGMFGVGVMVVAALGLNYPNMVRKERIIYRDDRETRSPHRGRSIAKRRELKNQTHHA